MIAKSRNFLTALFLVFGLAVPDVIFGFSQTAFAQEQPCGCWIDTKTLKPVDTVPANGANFGGPQEAVQRSESDPNTAFDRTTGRNFAREPCPPPSQTGALPAGPAAPFSQFAVSGGFNFRFGSEGTELGGDFNRTGDDVSVLQPGFTMQVRTPIGMYFGMPMNVGVEGTIDLSGPATGLRIDLHPASPDGVRDTFIKQNDYASISPFVGFELGQIGNVGELYGMVGLRGTLKNVKGITDESAGGGEREEFSETKFLLGPMVGLELGIGGALANLGNFGNLGGYDDDGEDRVKLRFDLEYRPGTEVSGQSSLGFDYDFRTKGTVLGTLGITYEY